MIVRLVDTQKKYDLNSLFARLDVTTAGTKLMAPKASLRVVVIKGISSYAALILKQEMLSLGGDVAVPEKTLTGNCEGLSCVLIASDRHLEALYRKLKLQSRTIRKLSDLISTAVADFDKEKYLLRACGRKIHIKRPLIMGIINATPDSFSGDGLFAGVNGSRKTMQERVAEMFRSGVDIFDVGGESTRPYSEKISVSEEIRRVIPVIEYLVDKYPRIPVSVDTSRYKVAEAALDAGAVIVNDISGLASAGMLKLIARTGAGVCIMHMQGTPRTMQTAPYYDDVIEEIYDFLSIRVQKALDAGICRSQIMLDVGLGFGKRLEDNLELIKNHGTFKSLGFPILFGASRKSFIGTVLHRKDPEDRVLGTALVNLAALSNGASVLRVHDVSEGRQTVDMFCALR